MATRETTTLRVPTALRDRIARIADERRTTLLDVVTDAVDRLDRDRWWEAVHATLDDLQDDDFAGYQTEAGRLGGTTRDGLDG